MTKESAPEHPDALSELQMENELLALQARVIRAQNAAVEDRIAAIKAEMQLEIEAMPRVLIGSDQVVIGEMELQELRDARGQLRWLVKRLGSSPAGMILRRWQGWRTLEARWR